MASGNYCIELTDAGTWGSFPRFAKKFVKQIEASVAKKIDGPDVRIWEIVCNGAVLNLVYDDFPNGISIEPKNKNDQQVIDELFVVIKEQSSANGI